MISAFDGEAKLGKICWAPTAPNSPIGEWRALVNTAPTRSANASSLQRPFTEGIGEADRGGPHRGQFADTD